MVVSYLKISLSSVQQDLVEEFHIFLLHQFVRVNPGALMEPQVNEVHGVTDRLWQGKQDALCTNIHGVDSVNDTSPQNRFLSSRRFKWFDN